MAAYGVLAELTGHVSESQTGLVAALAEGGVGLIIHAITCIHPAGQISPYINYLAHDEFISGMQKLTKAAFTLRISPK